MTNDRKIRDLDIDIGGKSYRLTSDDEYLESIRQGFEPSMVELFKTLAAGSDVILDIGANIGCTALLFSELASAVHAFEPSPSTFGFLTKNIKQNQKKNLFAHNVGMGSESSNTTLTFAPANRSGAFVSEGLSSNSDFRTEEISIETLDRFVSDKNISTIDFIKIDVEGFEAQVIRGGQKALAKYRPIVVLELNHWTLNALQRTSVPDFFDFLRAQFPILLAIDRNYYMDLHDAEESYSVMYQHIVNGHFNNLVAAFDESQVAALKQKSVRGFYVEVDRSWRTRLISASKILLGRQ